MGKEIERKFLLRGDEWRKLGTGVRCRQGYLCGTRDCVVRIRIMGERAFLTIKGRTAGLTRDEYEYSIPPDEAGAMLERLAEQPLIDKIRYAIPYEGRVWEVDEFLGANAGLLLAEVELNSEDQPIHKPSWVGEEVSGDPRYYNSNLVKHPYTAWGGKSVSAAAAE